MNDHNNNNQPNSEEVKKELPDENVEHDVWNEKAKNVFVPREVRNQNNLQTSNNFSNDLDTSENENDSDNDF